MYIYIYVHKICLYVCMCIHRMCIYIYIYLVAVICVSSEKIATRLLEYSVTEQIHGWQISAFISSSDVSMDRINDDTNMCVNVLAFFALNQSIFCVFLAQEVWPRSQTERIDPQRKADEFRHVFSATQLDATSFNKISS